MALANFEGKTFLAFVDISGFKKKMNDKEEALNILNIFYSKGYDILENNKDKINGIFISDCGILFIKANQSEVDKLKTLLTVIKKLNEEMLKKEIMLTNSIAYGEFKYENKIEFLGIIKNPTYGYAYIDAYFDNEKTEPRIQPGECRIINNNLPSDVTEEIDKEDKSNNPEFKLVRKVGNSHYYYFWMAKDESKIDEIQEKYKDAKYIGMLKILKDNIAETGLSI